MAIAKNYFELRNVFCVILNEAERSEESRIYRANIIILKATGSFAMLRMTKKDIFRNSK